MEEQKNETMETEDKEAGADTAADLEETVQQGADGQRTDEEADEPEADGAEKDDSETDESEEAEEPGENIRTIPPIHQAGTGYRIGGQLLFKNEFTITKEVYLEFVKAFMGQYRKLYYIMGGVSIILGLFSIIGGAFSSGIVFLLVGIICLVMPFSFINPLEIRNLPNRWRITGENLWREESAFIPTLSKSFPTTALIPYLSIRRLQRLSVPRICMSW
mgnify:CR=1 FL=1